MTRRSPRWWVGRIGLANAILGGYVFGVIVYFSITVGTPPDLWAQLIVVGLAIGGISLAGMGTMLFIRAFGSLPVRGWFGLLALLGLPAALASAGMLVFLMLETVQGAQVFARMDAEIVVVLVAFLAPLPVCLGTAMAWLALRGRIDDAADAADEPLHG